MKLTISKSHPAVSTIYADGGFDFNLDTVPFDIEEKDEHRRSGHYCPHGRYSPSIYVRHNYCAECRQIWRNNSGEVIIQ